ELRAALAADRRATRRGDRTRLALIGVATVAAAVAIAAVGIPRLHRGVELSGPQTASAAVVKARLGAAFATMRNLGGVLIASGPAQGKTAEWRFVLDAAGDVRLVGPRAGDVTTYDASTGIARSAQHSASLGGDTLFYAERDGVAPGPPDGGP